MIRQQVLLDDPTEIAGLLRRLPSAFPEALVVLMKWRGVSSEALAKEALSSKSTINRLRKEPDYVSSMDTILAICVALHLPPAIYVILIQMAGHSFKASERHVIIQQLLPQAYYSDMDIYEFNEELSAYGVAPVGRSE